LKLSSFYIFKSFVLTLITVLSQRCVYCPSNADDRLVLKNNSRDTIYYSYSFEDKIKYPFQFKNNVFEIISAFRFLPNTDRKCSVYNTSWDKRINESKDSSVCIYFFEKNFFNSLNKDSISKDSIFFKQLYTKKYKFKVKDLDKMDWVFVFKGL